MAPEKEMAPVGKEDCELRHYPSMIWIRHRSTMTWIEMVDLK